jgi:uncharacterized protein
MNEMDQTLLGRVMAVSGSQMMVALDGEDDGLIAPRIGALLTAPGDGHSVIGSVASIEAVRSAPRGHVLLVDLLGEIDSGDAENAGFHQGVSRYPSVGTPVLRASKADQDAVFAKPADPSLQVGTHYDDPSRPAYLLIDELLGKHFAVLGTTGSGKSCAVTLILSSILQNYPNAHVILLDPHNEYANAFKDLAEVVSVENLRLPLWLLDFEEAVRTLVRGGSTHEQEAQAIILKHGITWARQQSGSHFGASPTVDTPVPYRIFDLLRFINEEMGRLGRPDTATPYLRLRTRLESLRDDRRFAFMISDSNEDTLSSIMGRLLRIPVSGKPLTIVDLSGVPSEITDVVVSLSCRIVFDFAVWSDQTRMPPTLLVCEEAQRYVPSNERLGFAATARAVSRIATEGRKYGISLALVSQRPSELSRHALSQCGTVFALRMGDEADQRFVSNALPDVARGMVAALPSLPSREAVVSGAGVRLPTRVRFDYLPPERRPLSGTAKFSKAWATDAVSQDFRDDAVRRWRTQSRS